MRRELQISLVILSGAQAGEKILLTPGLSVRIGREAATGCAIRSDRVMSREHLIIEATSWGCRVRDLGSQNGTFVNGHEVAIADLKNGDEILAGETRFFVVFEQDRSGVEPGSGDAAAAQPPELPSDPQTPQEKLLSLLCRDLQPLYALLDAAVEPDVLKVIHDSDEDRESLLEGVAGVQLVHFAPHLIRLPQKSPLLRTLVEKAWGKHWGIFIASSGSLRELTAHLREILTARLPDGRQMHFRYYDPRILRVFLPTCLPDEINQFFGPVKYFVMEDENPDTVLRFSNTGRGVERKSLLLATPKVA